MDKQSDKYRPYFVYLVLAMTTFTVFWQVHNFEFTNYDDDKYVSENKHISTGLTRDNIIWVFTTAHVGNWHPVTGLSHILDCQFFDLKPGLHHLVNLFFHIANTLLLFTVLRKMTGVIWPSAFVAALFAVHPLHVESVAWISERKDVLSTFFWLLTMTAYFNYAQKPNAARYILAFVLFAMGLMAKPMLVTLPFVLLLLDYWPLNRMDLKNNGQIFRLLREKIPFFILSVISSIVTFKIQKSSGAVSRDELLPMMIRVNNAVLSYGRYLLKTIWPTRLVAFYPHPGNMVPLWQVLTAVVLLLFITVFVICCAKKYRYLFVGWFWYLGTLVPVIGFVQVGSQAMADRYSYIPLIGLFIIVAWGANDLLIKWRYRKIILGILAFVVLTVLTICTKFQISYWQDSFTLWQHALKVNKNDSSAHYHLAAALAQEGRFEEAAEHGRVALQLRKNPNAEMLYNMGSIYNNLGRYTEATEAFVQAIKVDPNCADAYVGLGNTLGKLGRHKEAEQAARQAIKIEPDLAEAYSILGAACFSQNDWTDAIEAFRQAVRIQPDYAQAYYSLGLALLRSGDKNAALKEYQILKSLDPQKADLLLNLLNQQK